MKDDLRLTRLRTIVSALPEEPGCYQYLDGDGTVIYVGKAKNLKRRVGSYFHGTTSSKKTQILVSKIQDIKYVVVPTDEDALLLENNLIKKYKPRYNILLKDDKTYPSVCVSNEEFPRVFKTRKIIPGLGTYYGPFSHQGTLNNMLELINRIYPLRKCRTAMTVSGVREGKWKTCLEYHIKNCKAPCAGLQSREDYMESVNEVREILKGNTRSVCDTLRGKMQELSDQMRFEEAMEIKRKYDLALEFCEKSEVIAQHDHNIDVFSIADDDKSAFINYLHVSKGCINQAFTFEYTKRIDEDPKELLALGIVEMRQRYGSDSREIIVPFPIETELKDVTVTVPQRGDKKHLLELSLANVRQYRFDKAKQAERLNPEQRATNLLRELQDKLKLGHLPLHIECFDNSNIQGADAVAGCVVFRKAKAAKSEYRKYIIKTVEGPDDYASMAEVVYRRYRRIIDEGGELPGLIIADGGKGQMEVIRQVVEEQLHLDIPIAGLAKDGHHRTSELLTFQNGQTVTVGMDVKSALFQFLTRIQDEVHRYAIQFHRDKRSKHQTESELDGVKGIGKVTKTELLRHFKSVKRIKATSEEDIAKIVGKAKAKIIKETLGKE